MRDPDDALISRLRFRHLDLIRSLSATGSLNKPAKALSLSQPAISKALVEIESSFGFKLFERSPAGVAMTPRGQTILEGATLLLNGLRHVRLSAARADRRIVIRLGVSPFIGVTLVPRLLWTLRKQGDEASVSLREGRGPQTFDLFRSGELDALLMTGPSDLVQSQPAVAMTMKPLFEEGSPSWLLSIIRSRAAGACHGAISSGSDGSFPMRLRTWKKRSAAPSFRRASFHPGPGSSRCTR